MSENSLRVTRVGSAELTPGPPLELHTTNLHLWHPPRASPAVSVRESFPAQCLTDLGVNGARVCVLCVLSGSWVQEKSKFHIPQRCEHNSPNTRYNTPPHYLLRCTKTSEGDGNNIPQASGHVLPGRLLLTPHWAPMGRGPPWPHPHWAQARHRAALLEHLWLTSLQTPGHSESALCARGRPHKRGAPWCEAGTIKVGPVRNVGFRAFLHCKG